jgi:hypothetical protein
MNETPPERKPETRAQRRARMKISLMNALINDRRYEGNNDQNESRKSELAHEDK